MINLQDFFDKAVYPLFAQGKACRKTGTAYGCVYQNGEGLRCVVGHNIPESILIRITRNPEHNESGIPSLLHGYPELKEVWGCDGNEQELIFLEALQNVHDARWNEDPWIGWTGGFAEVAERFGITFDLERARIAYDTGTDPGNAQEAEERKKAHGRTTKEESGNCQGSPKDKTQGHQTGTPA